MPAAEGIPITLGVFSSLIILASPEVAALPLSGQENGR
jgi:hypothetical protein